MFQRLGQWTARYRIPIILGWIGLAIGLMLIAPDLASVSSTDQADFLPANAPFNHAQELYEETFPALFAPSSTMVLVDAGEGGDVRAPEAQAFIADLADWLRSEAAPDNITEVSAPTDDPDLAGLMISPDGRLAIVSVSLDTPMDALATAEAVSVIDDWLAAHPTTGLATYQTGEGALNAQAEESTFTTMDRTLLITIALVIVALLIIYRSPVSPLIPLSAVTLAFLVTMGLVAILAGLDVIAVIAQVNAMLVVIIYGAGTDYCLFLISRFREEMAVDHAVQSATARTVRLVGETISSSAATIFVGFVSMSFAEIGALRSAGPMLAIGIAVTLAAGLTLVPALLALLGDRAFWPGRASHRASGRLYEITSKQVSTRPLLTIVLIVAVMVPFSLFGLTRELNYDFVSQMPPDIPSVKAYYLLQEHMGGGAVFPLAVVMTGQDSAALPGDMLALEAELAALDGVADVRSLNAPLGQDHARYTDLMRVDGQLRLIAALSEQEGGAALDPAQMLDAIGGMQAYLDQLAERFPALADDPNLATLREIVGSGLLGLALRQGELLDAAAALANEFASLEDATLMPPTGEGELFAALRPLAESYVTPDGTAYRLDVVLAEPLSSSGMALIADIRAVVDRYTHGGDGAVSGFTAMMADLQDSMQRDTARSFAIILGGIFLVLLVMLRSVVAPIYLIGTVLLSFTCTLGLTSLFYAVVLGVERLSWLLPLFMFVFLVALGIDYSIFLFGRIKEEVGRHGLREGVHVAVAATGAIITSAGVILAGTFAGMMAGELAFLSQLGFAVSVGVLIDTFVVRTILDPALAALFGRWTWWPGGVPRGAAPGNVAPASATPAPESTD